MKYETTEPFDADWDHLSSQEQQLFLQAVREINRRYVRRERAPSHLGQLTCALNHCEDALACGS